MTTSQQVHSAPSPSFPPGKEDLEEPGNIDKKYGDGQFEAVDFRGRPVDKSKTGRLSAAKYGYVLTVADMTVSLSITVGLLFYLTTYLHQQITNAATISNNFTGTYFLLSVLGGFVADSYLGCYFTIVVGAVIEILGLALLVVTSNYSKLQPPACTALPCPEAGGKYMAPLYAALYTLALGSGFIKACAPALGAEQFDESDPVEKRQSVHYFTWFYFSQNLGLVFAFSLSVYILSFVSKDWGFSWLLIFFVVGFLIFLVGTPQYRQTRPSGSFLTRTLQVLAACLRKRNLVIPQDTSSLYDAPISGGWLERSRKLRFLDRAAIIDNHEVDKRNRWRLAGVTQVEETKRILQILPVWACTWYVSLLFAQVVTYTATQGQSLDRDLSKHFEVPSQSLGLSSIIISIVFVPIFDGIMRPILRKWTKNPFGVTPLTRIAWGLISATLAMVSGALVERKRLGYIRDLPQEARLIYPLQLEMTMWWLLPQYFFTSMAEFGVLLASYEFFYHEVSDNTRSIGVSFSFAALSFGYYFSSVLVNVTNSMTKDQSGGRWLVERFDDGGLENYYWLLAAISGVNFLVFLVVAYFYQYNYTLYLSPRKDSTADQTTLWKRFKNLIRPQ